MKSGRVFWGLAVVAGLGIFGCGGGGGLISDLETNAPGREEVLGIVADQARCGVCQEEKELVARKAGYRPMSSDPWGNDEDVMDISFWLSPMGTEVDTEADTPTGMIEYSFAYIEGNMETFLIGLISFDYEWNGSTWVKVGYQIECNNDVTGNVTGIVVNAITGEPVEGVGVYAESESGFKSIVSRSDAGGRFWTIGVVPGKATLKAFAPGFEEARVPDLEVRASSRTYLERVEMVPSATEDVYVTVAGKITFRDGETPLSGVSIFGEEYPTVVYLEALDGGIPGFPGTVDSDGQYRIPFVSVPGQYRLRFNSQGLSTFLDQDGIERDYIEGELEESDGPMFEVPDLVADNMPPVLEGVEASGESVPAGETISLKAFASDPDGDYINYYWNFSGGMWFGIRNEIEWQAPETPGIYQVELIINDGMGGSYYESGEITVTAAE